MPTDFATEVEVSSESRETLMHAVLLIITFHLHLLDW